jgi:mannan endo-1,4-beta-mannosidase
MRLIRHASRALVVAAALSAMLASTSLADARAPLALGLTISPEWGSSRAWWNDELDTLNGRTPAIMSILFAWNGPHATAPHQTALNQVVYQPTGFPAPEVLDHIYSRGAVPLLMWQPNLEAGETLQTILDGRYDAYIAAWARAAAADGRPLLLRFAQEMNAPWFPWGANHRGNSAADFVAVWRKIWNAFRGPNGAGATNVRFVWSPNVSYRGSVPLEDVWPGNGYVQVIGLDGYNWYDFRNDRTPWKSMRTIFGPTLDEIAARWPNKPVVICEVGSVNDHPGDDYDKGRWLARGLRYLYEEEPQVKGFVYFDIRVIGSEGGVNWRLDSSDSALRAWRDLSTDPRFMGTLNFVDIAKVAGRRR